MKKFTVKVKETGLLLVSHGELAESFFQRLRGLLGRGSLEKGSGMLLLPCREIHTWFMQFPIDVIFLKKQTWAHRPLEVRVSSLRERVLPWRALPLSDLRAHCVLELPSGTVVESELKQGDLLCFDW